MPWSRRLFDGVPPDASIKDHASLILVDGQQRLTAVYQSCFVKTPVKLRVGDGERFVCLFFDMAAAVTPDTRIKDAIITIPTDANGAPLDPTKAEYFDPDFRYHNSVFPANAMFDFDAYEDEHRRFWEGKNWEDGRYEADQNLRAFRSIVVLSFLSCSVTLQVLRRVRNPQSVVNLYGALNMHTLDEGFSYS
jgi:hypothetical protein